MKKPIILKSILFLLVSSILYFTYVLKQENGTLKEQVKTLQQHQKGLLDSLEQSKSDFDLFKSDADKYRISAEKKIASIPKPSNKLSFNEIKFNLMDATYKKAKSLLGEPDKDGILYMGSETKRVYIYKNKVQENGQVKHLVLCFRDNNKQAAYVEEIYAIRDNEKAYYGIHWVQVNNGKFSSNSYDFDY